MLKVFNILIFFLLASCTSLLEKKAEQVDVHKNIYLKLPQPKDVVPSLEASQLLTVQFSGKTYSVQILMSNKDNILGITGLSTWGAPLFSANYNGDRIQQTQSGVVHLPFEAKYILADIIMVLGKSKELQSMFVGAAVVRESILQREIYFDGKKAIEIKYEKKKPWMGEVKFVHFLKKYKISIKTLKVSLL